MHHKKFTTREEARRDIFWYIEIFYNRKRRHQALDYLPPVEYKRRYLSNHEISGVKLTLECPFVREKLTSAIFREV